jgi:hypothetical protein
MAFLLSALRFHKLSSHFAAQSILVGMCAAAIAPTPWMSVELCAESEFRHTLFFKL